MTETTGLEIAIIGMAGRFPEAADIEAFWGNLCEGKDCVRDLSDEELRAEGVDEALLDDPRYVKRVGVLDDEDLFDAQFFDFNPREAELIDPQQRIFLEVVWEALEHAGVVPDGASIGVYAGTGANYYATNNLMTRPDYLAKVDPIQMKIGMDPDFIATRVCYKLNLQGPGVTIQSACSTSLVSVHEACQALLAGACDVAVAGGVGLHVPQRVGSLHTDGGIVSKDGYCRAFDATASGTIGGNGAGAVVLKRLEDAMADRDSIVAVVKATAINNDGSRKVGFTAPSIEGQSRVIRAAQRMAGVSPDTIGYVEAHGTGTKLGDPIEMAALTKAFRQETDRTAYCAIGSAKSAIGHLDTGAGIAGLIKAALVVERAEIPPTLHFTKPNPELAIDTTPFRINAERTAWDAPDGPRRAAVSSFGIGGTNAHAILEQAPPHEVSERRRRHQVLTISAKTVPALDAACDRLAEHLRQHTEQAFSDTAYTLQTGRTAFGHRRVVVAADALDAASILAERDPQRSWSRRIVSDALPVAFLFPGQGAQYVGMASGLVVDEPVFREALDRCAERLEPLLGIDLRTLILPSAGADEASAERLAETRFTQPALFAVEWALAQLWRSWSVEPTAMIGHSIGEWVAATVAGVFSLDDALQLVVERGRAMHSMPPGAMLSVPLSAAELEPRLGHGVGLAAENAPGLSTVSGPIDAIDALIGELAADGVQATRLRTSHAFHSAMMDPVVDAFAALVEEIPKRPPTIPFVSNVTGDWITGEQACSGRYWADHLRLPVRFVDGARRLSESPIACVEVGPGKTLATLIRRCTVDGEQPIVEPSLRHPKAVEDDGELMLRSLARLWMHGVSVDWHRLHDGHGRRKVALPSYPFQRRRYWVEPGDGQPAAAAIGRVEETTGEGSKLAAPEDWLHVPVWRPERVAAAPIDWQATGPWLALVESVDDPLARALTEQGATVTLVLRGEAFAWRDPVVTIDPRRSEDYTRLIDELAEADRLPRQVLHAWTVTTPGGLAEVGELDAWETRAFFSLVDLARALGQHADDEVQRSITVVSNELFDVSGAEVIRPEKALVEGPLRVIPAEYPTLQLTAVDIARNGRDGLSPAVARRVLSDLVTQPVDRAEPAVAYRGSQRWRRGFEPHPLPKADRWVRDRGVILITGGLGGIGLALAERLAADAAARLVLVGRSAMPPRDAWEEHLASRDEDLASILRRLVAIEEAGGEVSTLSADVTDGASLRSALVAVRERFGALHGVVHSAGVAGGGLIESRSADDVARVFDAKVRGVPLLWEALDEVDMVDGLDFFALSSSLSAVLGGVGQVDYVAANAFLDAWAREHRRQGGPAIVSIGWDTWSESGMAVAALANGGPALLTARGHDHPLLDRTLVSNDERRVVASELAADRPWVLAEHQIEGVSLLPGTAYLELAVGALDALPCRVEALSLLNPVFAPDEGALEVRTFLTRRDDGGWDVSIASLEDAADGRWSEYTRARIRPVDGSPPEPVDVDALRASCREAPTEIDPAASRHGPHWAIRGAVYRLGDDELLARLSLPDEYADEVASFVLHPSLMDAATSFFAATGAVRYLPVSYEAVTVSRRLTATVWSHVRRHEDTRDGDETLRFDIDLLDASGGRLARVEGYTLRRIEDTAMRLEEGRAALSARPRSAPARGELDDGLSDVEGAEVLSRVLADGALAQVLVSTVPLAPRIERYRATTLTDLLADTQKLSLPTDRHPRPEISTAYLAPRTEEETVVAEIWAELLGLDAIGVFDDFFELGGHSLLGIQINARLNDRYAVELAPGIIFERPTVALFAEALVDRQGEKQLSILEELAVVDAAEGARAGEDPAALGVDVDQLSEGDLDAMLAAMMGEDATS